MASTLPSSPTTADTAAPRAARVLWLIFLSGAVLRLGLWFLSQGQPLHIHDEREYNTLAKNLAEHGEFAFTCGEPATLRPPLYPALVALVYRLFGVENFEAVRLLQAALSLVNVWLLFQIGVEVYSRRVGLWAAGLYGFYPSLLGYNNLLLTEVLFTLLLCAFAYALILFLRREALGYAAAAGVLLGLATLTRSVLWVFPPVLILYLLVLGKGPFFRRAIGAAVLVVSFAAMLAPWAVRNTRLENSFVVIDTMGGRNFMMGNYRYTPLYRSWDAISLQGEENWFHEVMTEYPGEERNSQGKIDKLALRQGLKFVREHPGLTLQRDVVKFFDFWGLERELIAGASRGSFGPMPGWGLLALTVVIFGSYAAAVLAAVFGMILVPPGDRSVFCFLLLLLAFICGMHTLVFAHSRYHLPLMPLVLLFSASALTHARWIWQRRRQRSFWLAGGVCAVFVLGWLWFIFVVDLDLFRQALNRGT